MPRICALCSWMLFCLLSVSPAASEEWLSQQVQVKTGTCNPFLESMGYHNKEGCFILSTWYLSLFLQECILSKTGRKGSYPGKEQRPHHMFWNCSFVLTSFGAFSCMGQAFGWVFIIISCALHNSSLKSGQFSLSVLQAKKLRLRVNNFVLLLGKSS